MKHIRIELFSAKRKAALALSVLMQKTGKRGVYTSRMDSSCTILFAIYVALLLTFSDNSVHLYYTCVVFCLMC
jgi:hypothetical protein